MVLSLRLRGQGPRPHLPLAWVCGGGYNFLRSPGWNGSAGCGPCSRPLALPAAPAIPPAIQEGCSPMSHRNLGWLLGVSAMAVLALAVAYSVPTHASWQKRGRD